MLFRSLLLSTHQLYKQVVNHHFSVLPLVEIDLGNLKNEVGESSTNTLDGSQGKHGLALTLDVCVLDSENVNEFFSLDQVE